MSSTRVIRRQNTYIDQALEVIDFTQIDEYPPDATDTRTRLTLTQNPSNSRSCFVITEYNRSGGPKQGPLTKVAVFRYGYSGQENPIGILPDNIYNIPGSRQIIEFTSIRSTVTTVISPVTRPAYETWKHHKILGPGSNTTLPVSWQNYNYNLITQAGGNANATTILDPTIPTTMISVGNDVQTVSPTAKQLGIDTKLGGFLDLYNIGSGANGSTSVTLSVSGDYRGDFTFKWEATDHVIDGLGGDTPPVIQSNFILFKDVKTIFNASCNIQANFSLSEDSVSVITGVSKNLQNNFTLSAIARVEHFATETLTNQTELLATVFNFRFMDSLTITNQHTLFCNSSMIYQLPSSLLLSNDFNSNFTGNMIYDITIEYTWDDFGIVGYFITGYTVRGYSTNQSEYTWQELLDSWDSWTYGTWQGNETGWDQWPEDIWNSTKRLSFDFNFTQAANAIRGGVSQLLSTTALSENSAFRIEGVPGEIRSDFLCDGSPSGLMGGSSTIISDAVLTALGNYIIDNAQNITGAFDATLLANYIVQFLWQAQSDFSLAVTPTFKPGGVTNAQCITIVDALGNAIYGPSKTLQGAFDPEFIARIFFNTDPYQIYKVLQETRQIFVDAESRGIEIPEEIRLNSIPAELRDWLVPQETRNMKLRIPPMTNRFTTPKIRRE